MLSDAEVICTFMEPRPLKSISDITRDGDPSPGKWWDDVHPASSQWRPCRLTLDRLREVESRLTEEQQLQYLTALLQYGTALEGGERLLVWASWRALHASAEQKIAALATVLRPVVEGGSDGK